MSDGTFGFFRFAEEGRLCLLGGRLGRYGPDLAAERAAFKDPGGRLVRWPGSGRLLPGSGWQFFMRRLTGCFFVQNVLQQAVDIGHR